MDSSSPFTKLAAPAQRALANAGIKTLQQLTLITEAELMQLHGIGKNALQKLKVMLNSNNLSFKK